MDGLKQLKLAPALKPYWTFREELTVENGMVLKDTHIVIPKKMRKQNSQSIT